MVKRKRLSHYYDTYEEWIGRQTVRPTVRQVKRVYIQDAYEKWINERVKKKIKEESVKC